MEQSFFCNTYSSFYLKHTLLMNMTMIDFCGYSTSIPLCRRDVSKKEICNTPDLYTTLFRNRFDHFTIDIAAERPNASWDTSCRVLE